MAQPPAVPPEVAARHREIYRDLPGFEWEPLSLRVACGRNPLSEQDVRELAARGVTHVLDLREPHEWEGAGRVGRDAVEAMTRLGIDRSNFAIPDGGSPPPERISAIVDWIERAHAEPATHIYVHCRGGVERTGTVLLAWYAFHEDVDFETAQVELVRRAPRLNPLPKQIAAVESWLRQERASGRRPHPRRRPVRAADFVGGPADFLPRRLPERHVTIAVPIEVRLEPWEMRRVRLGFLPQEMEEKWLLVWERPHLRALRSWTGFEVFRLELTEHPDGSATWTHLLASREREQYTGTDPDQDLQWAAALLSGLAGGRPLLRVADDEEIPADDEPGLEALRAWSMMGAGVSTRDPGIPI